MDLSPLSGIKNVHIYQEYVVNWGSFNHLKAILLLAEEALKNTENTFFHLISGQDFPVKEIAYFDTIDQSKNYLEYTEITKAWKKNHGMERLEYYRLHDFWDAKRSVISRYLIFIIFRIQKTLKIKRSFPAGFPPLYGGSTWWSLTGDTLRYVVDYTKSNHWFLDRMKYTFCSEEIYFQTVVINSKYADSVINDNLRYIEWPAGKASSPTFLIPENFPKAISSNKLFARKLDENNAIKLKNLLTGVS